MGNRKKLMLCFLLFACSNLMGQKAYNLQSCIRYALENNNNIRKTHLDVEKSAQARREVTGALLPQISGSGSLNDNFQKAKFIMPNFMKEFLPPSMLDPNASDYMTIEMGLNYSTAIGAGLNQQILNFSLFNALDIAKTAESLSALAVDAKEEDVIAQTANLFYAVQVTGYAVEMFGRSINIIDSMLTTMEVSYANGLVKKVDLDRLKVTKTNLMTQRTAMQSAIGVQKNLLKLQMGLDVNKPVEIEKINLEIFENQLKSPYEQAFSLNSQTAYKILEKQAGLTQLKRKSAVYESYPVLTAMASYNYNGVSNKFFTGETTYWYPTSMVGLSLRVPIFGGLSRSAKIKQADIEIQKVGEDVVSLGQTLNMAFNNALLKLEDNRRTIQVQRDNMALAEDVYRISESNFSQGLASMTDVLNASNSLIQSQMNYADALGNFMKSWIELQKSNGTIRSLVE
ncbi:MAG TPA: TolC family protein [Bacteroidales bacterium]|nr:TolC family protein [Bacteroidales bacterium]HPT02126.1 TolC family protein [Bacteroidales bacterium]